MQAFCRCSSSVFGVYAVLLLAVFMLLLFLFSLLHVSVIWSLHFHNKHTQLSHHLLMGGNQYFQVYVRTKHPKSGLALFTSVLQHQKSTWHGCLLILLTDPAYSSCLLIQLLMHCRVPHWEQDMMLQTLDDIWMHFLRVRCTLQLPCMGHCCMHVACESKCT